MSTSFTVAKHAAQSEWLKTALSVYVTQTPLLDFNERLQCFIEALMVYGNLEAYELPSNPLSVIAYQHDTRRKRPSFLCISPGAANVFPRACLVQRTALYTIELVEAGEYAVAGASKEAGVWTAAEGAALYS